MTDKQIYYVSIPLGRMAAEPYDHTYQFKISATEIEATILQEKMDQMGDSELWVGILNLTQGETNSNDRRNESEHLLKEIYEMIDTLGDATDTEASSEIAPPPDSLAIPHRSPDDPTTAKHLGELLQ